MEPPGPRPPELNPDRATKREGRRQPALRLLRRLAWLALPIALAGELGHQILDRLRQELAHHFFHIIFGMGAALIFAVYVAFDIRKHGWPEFHLRWGKRPSGERTPPS